MSSQKKKIAEINCEEAASRFNDFIDNYLKGKSKDELAHHIENCRHCFDRLEFELLLKTKVAAIAKESSDATEDIRSKIETILSKT